MQIITVRELRGPNIYSYRPVIKVRLDLGEQAETPSNEIPGFVERLTEALPTLSEHHCALGYRGGFVERLHEGTYLAHVFEHVALEFQTAAGYDVRFGKARSGGTPGVYDVVLGYRSAAAAMEAIRQAEELINALVAGSPYDAAAAVQAVTSAGEADRLGPSTEALYQAACGRGIPVSRIGQENLLVLGWGRRQQRMWTTVSSKTGMLATDLACDKDLTKKILADGALPVPEGQVVENAKQAVQAMMEIGVPVVIKPLGGNQGKGVTLDIHKVEEAERAFAIAAEFDNRVVVEQFIPGRQYRLCVVNGKLVAAAERIPAYVIGDGSSTIWQLVDQINADPQRGDGHEKPLTKIKIDSVAIINLSRQGLTPDSIPADGKIVYIRENANLSTGGTAVDVTDIVHPETVQMAERAAKLIGLDIAGVDIVATDITKSLRQGGAIIEVNAAPGIRMHHYPSAGKSRDVAAAIIDYLFPHGDQGRIPIISVTGTNGKTTVTRMIGHIWEAAGYKVGMTTTDGIHIGGECIMPGDTTGPASARIVLNDPCVEVAVLETARGGLLRGGLAFDNCDVGIVTNVTEDHLGQDGIEDLNDLAYVKSLVLETVKPDGFAVINADDAFAAILAKRVRAEIMYFSLEPDNLIVRRHLGRGGKAIFVKESMIYAAEGKTAKPLLSADSIPATLGGIAMHNLQNAVIAAAACWCLRLPVSYICEGLMSFDENPGRFNLISLGNLCVCVDYGHNPAGYLATISTARRMGARRLVGVIAAPGDRRDDVVVNVGRIAGRGFDMIYIKEDEDLRGRQPGEIAALLKQGVIESGYPAEAVTLVLSEYTAVWTALSQAQPEDLIVVFYEKYDVVKRAIDEFRLQHNRQQAEAAGYGYFAVNQAGI
ncbi:MAG: cphA [Anaerosporomusa subterranea]|jgi:cyanophycin synthetase|nr:cphA [Anaerosporomusa subterranea]